MRKKDEKVNEAYKKIIEGRYDVTAGQALRIVHKKMSELYKDLDWIIKDKMDDKKKISGAEKAMDYIDKAMAELLKI